MADESISDFRPVAPEDVTLPGIFASELKAMERRGELKEKVEAGYLQIILAQIANGGRCKISKILNLLAKFNDGEIRLLVRLNRQSSLSARKHLDYILGTVPAEVNHPQVFARIATKRPGT